MAWGMDLCRKNRLLSAPPLHVFDNVRVSCRSFLASAGRGGAWAACDATQPVDQPAPHQSKLSPGTLSRESAAVSHERVGRARVDETVHLPHERLGCRRRLLVGQGGHDSIEVFVGGVEQPLS